jgi:magnesium transporter
MAQDNFAKIYLHKAEDIDELREELLTKYSIEAFDVEDALTSTQLSKYEIRNSYTYIALQFPDYDISEGYYITKELHFFIKLDSLIVYDKSNLTYFTKCIERNYQVLDDAPTPFDAFYEIMDYCVTRLARRMRRFADQVDELEDELFKNKGADRDFIFEIQVLKRNIINILSLINPLSDVLDEMHAKFARQNEMSKRLEQLDDTQDKLKKIRNNLRNFREQMTLMSETNEALIVRNTNEVLTIMTATSIMIIIPSFIAAFFGMNVNFGWTTDSFSPIPIALITIAMGMSLVGVLFYFRKRKWL